jgi:hypothetical protein
MRTTLAAIGSAVAVALFIAYFSTGASTVERSLSFAASSSTLSGIALAPPPLLLPGAATTSPAPAPALPAEAPAAPVAPPPSAAPAPAQVAATLVSPGVPQPAPAAGLASGALVNILCLSPAGSGLQSISGSGVIITGSGIILTNAHIGQYFLLADRGVSCTIRTGSPAKPTYVAAPIFVSPAWIADNPSVLREAAPTGTGEHDIALLAIDGSAEGAPLPEAFPFVPLEDSPPVLGEPIVIGSYAAQFLKTAEIENALSPTLVFGTIARVYTFAVNSVDIVSLGGNAAAQEGSSGGGAVDASGKLTATITTSTTAGDTSARQLDAITTTYIRRDYALETGSSLEAPLIAPVAQDIEAFAAQIPALESELDLPQ